MDLDGLTKVQILLFALCNHPDESPDLDPIPPEKRTWGGIDYWAYWCSDMLAPPLASTVSSVMALGFTARETIPIVFFGFLICSVVITLTGKMGMNSNNIHP